MDIEKQPSVAIIILNWNSYQDTYECLKSLEELNYNNFHVFLVDNASEDNSYEKLQRDYQNNQFHINITFLQSGGNLGFAGGNNIGIKEAFRQGYEYYWLLNNDTIVDKNALIELVKIINDDSRIGIVGSKIYYYGTNTIWFAGGKVNFWSGDTMHIGWSEEDVGQYDSICEVDYITGCSMLFRKELIEKIGYLREDYFLYYEETDYNVRVKKAQYRILFVPQSVVYHKVSVSSGGEGNLSPYYYYYNIRNSYLFVKNTASFFHKQSTFVNILWKTLKGIIKYSIFKRKFYYIPYILLGLKHAKKGPYGKLQTKF